MGPLECEDCGTGQGLLESVREPHFGRFCLPCLAKRDENGSAETPPKSDENGSSTEGGA